MTILIVLVLFALAYLKLMIELLSMARKNAILKILMCIVNFGIAIATATLKIC